MVMVQVNPDGKHPYTMDDYLVKQLNFCKNLLRDRWMVIFIIVSRGKPGPGKSTLGSQICKYIDPLFNMKQCVFTGKDLKDKAIKIGENRRGAAIQYDEAKEVFNKRRQMSGYFNDIDNFMDEARQFSPFFCLLTPNLFDLPKQYVNKCEAVINVNWRTDLKRNTRKRGYFDLWGDDGSLRLYLKGSKTENYKAVKPDYPDGSFNKYMTLDPAQYDAKKMEAAKKRSAEEEARAGSTTLKTARLLHSLHFEKGFSIEELMEISEYSRAGVYGLIKKYTEYSKSTI